MGTTCYLNSLIGSFVLGRQQHCFHLRALQGVCLLVCLEEIALLGLFLVLCFVFHFPVNLLLSNVKKENTFLLLSPRC
jgi:hypothetical protein